MSYLIRLVLFGSLLAAIFLIVSSFEDQNSIFVENTSESGVLFMNGLYQPGDSYCFTPENGQSYNIALSRDNTRQNIQVSKNTEITISSSEGEDLGLRVRTISDKDLESNLCN